MVDSNSSSGKAYSLDCLCTESDGTGELCLHLNKQATRLLRASKGERVFANVNVVVRVPRFDKKNEPKPTKTETHQKFSVFTANEGSEQVRWRCRCRYKALSTTHVLLR